MSPGRKEWEEQEIEILQDIIRAGLTAADAVAELRRHGYPRTLEGTAAKLKKERHLRATNQFSDAENAEMIKRSISRRWVP